MFHALDPKQEGAGGSSAPSRISTDHTPALTPVQERVYKISASLLPLKDESAAAIISQAVAAAQIGVHMLHVDVVSGSGVRTAVIEAGSVNTADQFTPALIENLKKELVSRGLRTLIDVHLMDENPTNRGVMEWVKSGADYISLHWEAFQDTSRLTTQLQIISEFGSKPGIALRPDTNLDPVIAYIVRNRELVRLVSQNGVLPCLGGQTLNHSIVRNISDLKAIRDRYGLPFEIMVDGGIEPELTGPKCFSMGADILVAGSAFFGRGRRDRC